MSDQLWRNQTLGDLVDLSGQDKLSATIAILTLTQAIQEIFDTTDELGDGYEIVVERFLVEIDKLVSAEVVEVDIYPVMDQEALRESAGDDDRAGDYNF